VQRACKAAHRSRVGLLGVGECGPDEV
jgi:hypothetical protein